MIRPQIPGAFRLVTLGCKANQYDSQVLREALLRHGWRETDEAAAELVLLNTCTVTGEAGRKARQMVRRFHRENPDVRVAITGCLAAGEPASLRDLPGVAWVLGAAADPAHFLRELGHQPDPAELGIPPGITEFTGHTRAFLKIQDGCNMRCAFCIIPSVRGPSRSRPAAELAAELRRLLVHGHREIVLCGIHIGHWGRDLGLRLGDLLDELVAVEGDDAAGRPLDWRLRLSSIEATEVDDKILAVLAEHPRRVAPHLHMPLQSGDDGVLSAMRRWYGVEEYLARCDHIRTTLDRPAFSTDVIVGFPGEDETAFAHTLDAVRQAGFARVHAFPFSPRPGTAAAEAATAPGRSVDPAAVRDRRDRLLSLATDLAATFRRGLVGTRDRLVLEGETGLSGRYQRVRVPAAARPADPTALLDVELTLDPATPSATAALLGHPRTQATTVEDRP